MLSTDVGHYHKTCFNDTAWVHTVLFMVIIECVVLEIYCTCIIWLICKYILPHRTLEYYKNMTVFQISEFESSGNSGLWRYSLLAPYKLPQED